MPRENALFRPYLERLDEKFPDKEIISQTECANFLGLCTKTVRKWYGIDKRGVNKMQLARILSTERR